MASWSRRKALRALGLSAALPAASSWLSACGAVAPRPNLSSVSRSGEEIRAQLRETLEGLARDYVAPTALAIMRKRGVAAVDIDARGVNVLRTSALVLNVQAAGIRYRELGNDLSQRGIEETATRLRLRVRRDTAAKPIDLATPRDFRLPLERDPAQHDTHSWLQRVSALFERGLRIGGSRVVYRGAHLDVDDSTTLFLGNGHDLSQRLVRSRAGVLFIAGTGAAPVFDTAENAGTLGLEVLAIDTPTLEAAAERALAVLTVRRVKEGHTAVVLDPSICARICSDIIAPALSARTNGALAGAVWKNNAAPATQLFGDAKVTVTDDPTLAGGFGSYFFDDEGHEAVAATLIDRGILRTPLTDRRRAISLGIAGTASSRRGGEDAMGPLAIVASNIAVAPGTASRDQLMAKTDSGLFIEGARSVHFDPRSRRLAIGAALARGIRGGKLSGERHGAVEFHTTLPDLFRQAILGDSIRFTPYSRDSVASAAGGPSIASRGLVLRG